MKVGRNDRCWCGSGKKYKRCHLGRDTQPPLGKQEILEAWGTVYEKGDCLHPRAGRSTCQGKIIRAHTIQRNGGLSRIAREGHVYNALKYSRMFQETECTEDKNPELIGVRKASTFGGFCSPHDNELFSPIEKHPFTGESTQVALLAYRAICYELFMKKCDRSSSFLQRNFDKGTPLIYQRLHQEAVSLHQTGVSKAIDELTSLKDWYDNILYKEHADNLGYYVVGFNKNPEVMCSATAQATHDFSGNKVHELGLNNSAGWLTFSLIATDDGGAAVFSWPADHRKSEDVMRTFHSLSDDNLPHAVIRFMFEFFENIYFSPEWWDGLEKPMQVSLMRRQLTGTVPHLQRFAGCLLDDGIRAVDWPVSYRLTTLDKI